MNYFDDIGLPEQVLLAVMNDDYDGPKPYENKISVSTLLDSPLQRLVTAANYGDINVPLSNRLWTLRGSAIHHILERGAKEEDLYEERLDIDFDGITITGKFDYYAANDKHLMDWKETTSYNLKSGISFKKHIEQLNIYAYMLRKTGFEVDKISNVYFVRDYFKNQHNAPAGVVVKTWPIMSDEDVEALMRERIAHHKLFDCSKEDRFAREGYIALRRVGRKTAIKRFYNVTDDDIDEQVEREINKLIETSKFKKRVDYYTTEEEKDHYYRCGSMCDCAEFCPKYLKHLGAGKRQQLISAKKKLDKYIEDNLS